MFLSYFSKGRKWRGHNRPQTVRCFLLLAQNSDQCYLVRNQIIFSLGLFHEITNRLSCMQLIHVHTLSGDQCQSTSPISSHSAPFSVFISIRRSSRRGKVHKSPHPTSIGDSSLRLPLSCRIAESSPHSSSHILVWQRGRQSQ